MNEVNKDDFNEKLIKAYIGPKADYYYNNMKIGTYFSPIVWVLGPIYYVYRKAYLVVTILFAIAIGLGLIMNGANFFPYLLGVAFFPLYRWDITRKLKKLKKDNPSLNSDQLIEKAKKMGGTNLIGAIVFTVAYIFFSIWVISLGGK